MRADYHIPTKFQPSAEVVHLVARMLNKDPAQRITVKELYEDPWFKQDFPDSVCSLNTPPPPPPLFPPSPCLHRLLLISLRKVTSLPYIASSQGCAKPYDGHTIVKNLL